MSIFKQTMLASANVEALIQKIQHDRYVTVAYTQCNFDDEFIKTIPFESSDMRLLEDEIKKVERTEARDYFKGMFPTSFAIMMVGFDKSERSYFKKRYEYVG